MAEASLLAGVPGVSELAEKPTGRYAGRASQTVSDPGENLRVAKFLAVVPGDARLLCQQLSQMPGRVGSADDPSCQKMRGDPGVERLAGTAQKSLQSSIGWHHDICEWARIPDACRHDHETVRVTHHSARRHHIFPARIKVWSRKRQ